MTALEKYYVYDLVDPRDGATFYVGKGKGDRLHHHMREAVKGKPGHKCNRIRVILESGAEHSAVIVARFHDEQDALDAEAARINAFGLDNLTNVMPNGWCFVPGTRSITKDVEQEAKRVVTKSAGKVLAIMALLASGTRFRLGEYDITTSVHAFIEGLKQNAGPEFDRLVGGVLR